MSLMLQIGTVKGWIGCEGLFCKYLGLGSLSVKKGTGMTKYILGCLLRQLEAKAQVHCSDAQTTVTGQN